MRNHPLVFSLAALLTSATFLCAQAPPASRNLILNGNFELHGGPGIIPRGWFNTVVPNRILFDAEGGRWAVALTGFIDGPTYQNISTVPGVTYRVRFAARAPVFGTDEFEGSATRQPNGFFLPDGPWVVNVYINGVGLGSFRNDQTNVWEYFTGDFVADSTTTTVAFGPGAAGDPLLDAVSVFSVPAIQCPAESTVECDGFEARSIFLSDPAGLDLTVIWNLNGMNVQTNTVSASSSAAGTNLSLLVPLTLGTNYIGVSGVESDGISSSCVTSIELIDTKPPLIERIRATPSSLWPPNHQMVPIRLTAIVNDGCGEATWRIVNVTSSDPRSRGGGQHSVDWQITGNDTVLLRADRSGNGDGRSYVITIQATDASGNKSNAFVTVSVPHDMRGRRTDSGIKNETAVRNAQAR